jgi:exodeoxyribonuclease VII small subunit
MNPDAIGDPGQAIMFEPTDDLELRAGRGEGSQEREQITFEQGYEELKSIVSRLDDPELPIHEMFEGFRRGKGLEKTLRAYLQEREGELAELEEGGNLAEFEIVAPSSGSAVR